MNRSEHGLIKKFFRLIVFIAVIVILVIVHRVRHDTLRIIRSMTLYYDHTFKTVSPESSLPWFLNVNENCSSNITYGRSRSSPLNRTCGFCQNAYFQEVRDELALRYKQKCKGMVVYGVAFGEKYANWLNEPDMKYLETRTHDEAADGTCFFQFVRDVDINLTMSADGLQNLIRLRAENLPYQNMRRNAKLFKLNPHQLFPWAERIIWQDAKMLDFGVHRDAVLPKNYTLQFEQTVQYFGTCASFMGFPRHSNTLGSNFTKLRSVTYEAQCTTVLEASKGRPTVSDNLDLLMAQCRMYGKEYRNTSSSSILDLSMIDSAFILYDMRTRECQQFISDLTCSWLDEIHCFSDRDQISFPKSLLVNDIELIRSFPKAKKTSCQKHTSVFLEGTGYL